MGCKDTAITIFHCLLILMLSILIYTTYTDFKKRQEKCKEARKTYSDTIEANLKDLGKNIIKWK